LIKSKGISQKDLSEDLEIPITTLNSWLNQSHPRLENIEKICNFLEVPIWEFFISKEELENKFHLPKEIIDCIQAISVLDAPTRWWLLESIKLLAKTKLDELKGMTRITSADYESFYNESQEKLVAENKNVYSTQKNQKNNS